MVNSLAEDVVENLFQEFVRFSVIGTVTVMKLHVRMHVLLDAGPTFAGIHAGAQRRIQSFGNTDISV
jgi:hypothetical protein